MLLMVWPAKIVLLWLKGKDMELFADGDDVCYKTINFSSFYGGGSLPSPPINSIMIVDGASRFWCY